MRTLVAILLLGVVLATDTHRVNNRNQLRITLQDFYDKNMKNKYMSSVAVLETTSGQVKDADEVTDLSILAPAKTASTYQSADLEACMTEWAKNQNNGLGFNSFSAVYAGIFNYAVKEFATGTDEIGRVVLSEAGKLQRATMHSETPFVRGTSCWNVKSKVESSIRSNLYALAKLSFATAKASAASAFFQEYYNSKVKGKYKARPWKVGDNPVIDEADVVPVSIFDDSMAAELGTSCYTMWQRKYLIRSPGPRAVVTYFALGALKAAGVTLSASGERQLKEFQSWLATDAPNCKSLVNGVLTTKAKDRLVAAAKTQ